MAEKVRKLSFEGFLLDPANALLSRGRDRIALPPKPFGVLCHLIERAGALVTKDELLDAVWRDLHVTESSLSVSINAVRLALGDDPKSPRFIETVTRRGYRFIAPVTVAAEAESDRRRSAIASLPANCAVQRPRQWAGRENALRSMHHWFELAVDGRRQIAFLTGESGIGKTTLTEMLVEQIAGRRVGIMTGRCVQHFGTDEAFLPLNEALAEACVSRDSALLLRMLRDHAPAWLTQLPAAIDARDSAALRSEVFGTSRERMLREFCELLEALGRERPWILILEDLHWSDYATLDLLSRFALRDQPTSVLIIATYRPDDVMAAGHPLRAVHQELQIHGRCVEIALDKLTVTEVEQYLNLRFKAPKLARTLAPVVTRRTGGLPLFVVSLADFFVDRAEIIPLNGGWSLAPGKTVSQEGIPRDLHEMIVRQIDRLLPEEQRLLVAASAIGAEFCAAAVAGGMNRDVAEVEQACADLARKGQVLNADGIEEWPDGTVSGRYAFLHAFYQEVLYERLPPGRRANLHRRIGNTLEARYDTRTAEIAAVLALHFEEGRDVEKAIRYLAAAAESSTKRFANQEAAVYLTRALSLADRMPGGDVALTARLDLLRQRGWVLRAAGDFPGSFADIAAMIAHAGEAKRPLVEVTGLLDLSRFCLYVDRSRCLELARQALVKSEELDDDAIKALAQGNNANLNLMLNSWRAEDAELCRQTLRTLADARDPRIVLRRCSIESVLHFLTSNYRGCCDSARLGQEITRAIGDVYYFVLFNVLEAFSYLNLGEWRLLQQSVKAALAMTEKNANRQAAVLCQLSLAFLETEALDFASAKRRAEMALDRTVEANPFNFFLGRNLLAKAHLGLREYDAAWSHFEQIRHKIEVEGVSMDSSIYPQYYYNLGEFWLEQGDVERARAQALQLNVRAAESKEQTYLALAQRQLGDIARLEGRFDDAGAHLAHAAAIVEATEAPLAAWRVHASAAQLYETIGDLREAAASQARCDGVVAFLADKFAEDDPLRASFLENYAGEARRCNTVSPAVLKYRAAPTAGSRSSYGENGSTLHKP
jgi:DNA-binding winged helix-turn-helix (wHTH) protein/tetratricopeptide (TPR) repeat protein